MKRLLTLAAACCLSLAACSSPSVYAPSTGPHASGFTENRIEADRWRVTYRGGGGASSAQVDDYALLRAAELTLENGYDWFRVENRYTEASGGGGGGLSIGVGGGSWGSHSGVGGGVSTGVPLGGGAALATTLEISMGKGEKPPARDAYDARSVQAAIRPRVGS
jgi:hypothetical protein